LDAGDLARLRKRLKFRSWHRGTKELDLIFGPFADACLDSFDAPLLAQYQALLDCPEPEMWDRIAGHQKCPAGSSAAFERLLAFHAARRDGR
jgi:antitoxin CptB